MSSSGTGMQPALVQRLHLGIQKVSRDGSKTRSADQNHSQAHVGRSDAGLEPTPMLLLLLVCGITCDVPDIAQLCPCPRGRQRSGDRPEAMHIHGHTDQFDLLSPSQALSMEPTVTTGTGWKGQSEARPMAF